MGTSYVFHGILAVIFCSRIPAYFDGTSGLVRWQGPGTTTGGVAAVKRLNASHIWKLKDFPVKALVLTRVFFNSSDRLRVMRLALDGRPLLQLAILCSP